jgi:hypothetical protein
LKEAKLELKAQTSGPMSAPPLVGPVSGDIQCRGGLSGEGGSGLDANVFVSELGKIYTKRMGLKESAQAIADVIHKYCLTARVIVDGNFIAPAAVSPPGAGAYMPGVGKGEGKIT